MPFTNKTFCKVGVLLLGLFSLGLFTWNQHVAIKTSQSTFQQFKHVVISMSL